ncbi:MAG TPA: hypothetical protein VND41_04485 [Nitrososphaerales archaeon]|nr:hypothetical protein [Nitrososphaerales archaeon]
MTDPRVVLYALCLYFLGLSFRGASDALEAVGDRRSTLPSGTRSSGTSPTGSRRQECPGLLVDETYVRVGSFGATSPLGRGR